MSRLKYGFNGIKTPTFYAKLTAVFTFYAINDGEDKPLSLSDVSEIMYSIGEYITKFGINGIQLTDEQLHELYLGLKLTLLNTTIDDDGEIESVELREFYHTLIEFFEEAADAFESKDSEAPKEGVRK
jgi:hypothetical protein